MTNERQALKPTVQQITRLVRSCSTVSFRYSDDGDYLFWLCDCLQDIASFDFLPLFSGFFLPFMLFSNIAGFKGFQMFFALKGFNACYLVLRIGFPQALKVVFKISLPMYSTCSWACKYEPKEKLSTYVFTAVLKHCTAMEISRKWTPRAKIVCFKE